MLIEPNSISGERRTGMQENELEVRQLLNENFVDVQKYANAYEYWAEDMAGFAAKVQWEFGTIRGYQIFNGTDYTFKMDAQIEAPDLIIKCDDLHGAAKFLRGGYDNPWSPRKRGFQVISNNKALFGDIGPENQFRMSLARIPAFRPLF
jgi:hypothetical protein